MDYKLSFYNIKLFNTYTEDPQHRDLYYNTMSNKFAEIPEGFTLTEQSEKLEELKEKRMVVPSSLNEAEQYKQMQVQAIENDYPVSVRLTVCPSMRCNYQCKYCFQGSHKNGVDMQGEVLQDTIQYIKNEIDRNKNLHHLHLKWFGGEPLLNMNAIRKISDFVIPYCKNYNIKYTSNIITNGYLFTKEISKELKALCVDRVQIAIDGFENDYIAIRKAPKNAYKQVLQNIEDSVIPVTIRLNTTRNNKEDIIKLAKELLEYSSVKENKLFIAINRVKDYGKQLTVGFTDDEWLSFREFQKDFNEIAIKDFVKIDKSGLVPCSNIQKRNIILCSDGNIYRCETDAGKQNKAIGSIKNSFYENNETEEKFVCSTITEICLNCKYLPICRGSKCRYDELFFGKQCGLIEGKFKQNMQNYLNCSIMKRSTL